MKNVNIPAISPQFIIVIDGIFCTFWHNFYHPPLPYCDFDRRYYRMSLDLASHITYSQTSNMKMPLFISL